MKETYSMSEAMARTGRTRQAIYKFAERWPSVVVPGRTPMRFYAHRIDEFARATLLVFGREGRVI